MKRIVVLLLIGAIVGSCSNYNSGELVGVQGRKAYAEPDPFGMVPIPTGSFLMGPSDQDVTWTQNTMNRTVAVDAFWMDETEITNNEYRQFVYWVRDSIIRKELAMQGIEDFMLMDDEGQPYEDRDGEPIIDWDASLDPSKDREGNISQIIEDLGIYYTGADRLSNISRELNVTKLIYNYYWVDLVQASKAANRFRLDYSGGSVDPVVQYGGTVTRPNGEQEEVTSRASFVNKDWALVYPDTLVWIADFTYSYNEPMANITVIEYKMNIETLERVTDDKEIKMNDICKVKIRTTAPIMMDKYSRNRKTGSFILIDAATNETVAGGMLR